jgi:hypothetical protein
MGEHQRTGFWDEPLTRRDVLRWAGFAGGSLVLGAAAQTVIKSEEQDLLRGPRWPLDWQRLTADADAIPWRHFPGHNEFLRLSDLPYHVGVMATDKAALDAQAEPVRGMQHAVAWRVFSNVIEVGVLDAGLNLDSAKAYPDKYIIGMGVGEGDLRATIGLWHPGDQQFVVPSAGVETLPPTVTYNMHKDYPGVMLV